MIITSFRDVYLLVYDTDKGFYVPRNNLKSDYKPTNLQPHTIDKLSKHKARLLMRVIVKLLAPKLTPKSFRTI